MVSPKATRFGVKGIIPYDRATRTPLGFAEIVSSGGLDLAGEMVALHGGSNRYAYDAAHGYIEANMSLTVKEFPSFLFTLMLGATPKTTDVSDAGIVRSFANKKGTSIISATTFKGIKVTDGKNADLKFGIYTVVVDDNKKLNVYISSDVDAGVGTPLVIQDDILRVNSEALTPADGLALENLGVEFEGVDSGFDAADFNAGDTATFEVVPKAKYFRDVTIGRNTDLFPSFGMYCISESISDTSLCLIDAFKCKANGLPQGLSEKSWSESELTIMPLIDGQLGVARILDIVR